MSDIIALNEIARNERIIEHPEYGRYLIRRPTYGIEAQIETARTRQLNRDLQAREFIDDPATGEVREVPAFLTRQARAEQLRFHGMWSIEDEIRLEEAADRYRHACFRLDQAGFEGTWQLEQSLDEAKRKLIGFLGKKADKYEDEIAIVIPRLETVAEGEMPEGDTRQNEYAAARKTLIRAANNPLAEELFTEIDRLHKLATMHQEAETAQAELVVLRIREINLFANTLESRADRTGQLATVFYCTFDPETRKCPWRSFSELEEKVPGTMYRWLLSEVERFQRMEPGQTDDDARRRERFNFLAPYRGPDASTEESQEATPSKPDGDSAESAPNLSIEA